MKGKRVLIKTKSLHVGLVNKVIPLMLVLDIVPSSSSYNVTTHIA